MARPYVRLAARLLRLLEYMLPYRTIIVLSRDICTQQALLQEHAVAIKYIKRYSPKPRRLRKTKISTGVRRVLQSGPKSKPPCSCREISERSRQSSTTWIIVKRVLLSWGWNSNQLAHVIMQKETPDTYYSNHHDSRCLCSARQNLSCIPSCTTNFSRRSVNRSYDLERITRRYQGVKHIGDI